MEYLFKKPNIKATFDYQNCSISSIYFNNEELIHKPAPLFRVKFRDHNNSSYWIDAFSFSFNKQKDERIYYTNENADVCLIVKQLDNGFQFGIEIKNKTKLLLEQVEIMTLGLYPKLMDEDGKGEMDIPYNEGARITSIKKRDGAWFTYRDVDYPSEGLFHVFPNMISSQFMTYICNKKGMYFGMHDTGYTPKHIDFHVVDDSLQTVMGTFTNCNYGEDYKMDYPSVLLFFEGNCFDGCELYRKWFYEHKPKRLKTIKERYDELPHWYHESPVILTYPLVGKSDYDTEMLPGGLYPYTNALPLVDYIAKETDSKVMVILMQWESTAPWAPPYVWPPYGDVDNFFEFKDKLHQKGNYLGLYTSGFGWTNVSYRREYNKTEEFEKNNLKEIMCSNSNGDIRSTIVTDIRLGYDMCPACDNTKEIIINETNKMVNAGVDYIQVLDQNHGGNAYFCYSDKHGHIPAPGKWEIEETRKILSSIDRSKCLLGCETAASEPFIDLLSFSDNRYPLIHHIGEAIPMYSYIYHEFVNNFMGNQVCCTLLSERYTYTYRVAYSFISGDLPILIVDGDSKFRHAWGNDTIIDEKPVLEFIKKINKWRVGKFEEFLHLGKMVKPLEFKCTTKGVGSRFYQDYYTFPSVLTSAYTNGKESYQFLVNYDLIPETITFDRVIDEIVIDSNGKIQKINDKKITIPPLSVIAIKL